MPKKKKPESEGEYPDTESEGEEESKPEEVKQVLPEIKPTKTKKPISPERKQHLDNIRVKALEAKQKQKEITLKKKLLKTVEREEISKKYNEYVAKQAPPQPTPQPIQQPQPIPQQKRERRIKKIIYESDDEEDDDSLNHLLYMDNKKKLHERVLNERIKSSILSYQNALMPQRY